MARPLRIEFEGAYYHILSRVKRLADYKWSSYPFYTFNTEPPDWLNVDPILAHFGKNKDRHSVYRKSAHNYSDEDRSIWEDVEFGFIYGSQAFIDRIKDQLSPRPVSELPELNKFLRSQDPEKLLNEAAQILNCDTLGVSKRCSVCLRRPDFRNLDKQVG